MTKINCTLKILSNHSSVNPLRLRYKTNKPTLHMEIISAFFRNPQISHTLLGRVQNFVKPGDE